MNTSELLIEAIGRVQGTVHQVVEDLSPDDLAFRPDAEANSIAWLVWHLTRIQDDHIADVAGNEQVWAGGGWADRFALPFDVEATGWGQTSDDVAAVQADAELLVGYYDAVHTRTVAYLGTIGDGELDRVVDESWDPPVTLGVRLVSVLDDDVAHAAQAAYVRGLVERRSG
jgi:hypothetical protein